MNSRLLAAMKSPPSPTFISTFTTRPSSLRHSLPARHKPPPPSRAPAPLRMISRRVSDLRHYPEGTDKAAARAIRAQEKKDARRKEHLERSKPYFPPPNGLGIFPPGNPERHAQQDEARNNYLVPNPRVDELLRRAEFELTGGPADHILGVMRCNLLDRHTARVAGHPVLLTSDLPDSYNALIDEIRLCDECYYSDDPEPRVTDAEYDELVMHLLDMENCFPELISPRSPSQNVAHCAARRATQLAMDNDLAEVYISSVHSATNVVPTTTRLFPQTKHKAIMLSLDNAYGHDDLVAFFRRAAIADSRVSAELKIDGLALSLEYRRRKLFVAATRGTGRIGEDVTENVRAALLDRGVVDTIEDDAAPDWLLVRGEVFIAPHDFRAVNASLERKMSNARNAAAGAIKHKDPAEARQRRLRFVAYECLTGELGDVESYDQATDGAQGSNMVLPATKPMFETQEATLAALATWRFGSMPRATVCDSLQVGEAFAAGVENERAALPLEVDGIVFKFDSASARLAAGNTARAPRGAIAYKFAAQTRVTTVDDVVMQVSRNGVITPVAVLRPVKVGGAVLSRATLHNFDEVRRLGVAVGDRVRVERGGDVIPKVVTVEHRSEEEGRTEIAPPDSCPSCGGGLDATVVAPNGVTLISCRNKDSCNAQTLGRVIHFVGRDAMDIQGLGKKTATKLVNNGQIVLLADLFRLTTDDILSIESFAQNSAVKLLAAIEEARTSRSLERLLIGLGLPGVGRIGARSLAEKVRSLDELLRIGDDPDGKKELLGVPNLAEKTASVVHAYLRRPRVRAELRAVADFVAPVQIVDEQEAETALQPGQTNVDAIAERAFAFTGKFSTISRPETMKWVKAHGGRVVTDVTRKTDFVIIGQDPGQKFFKAQRLKVPVVQEEEFATFFALTEEQVQLIAAGLQSTEVNKRKRSNETRVETAFDAQGQQLSGESRDETQTRPDDDER